MSASVLNGNHRQRQRQRVLVSSGADELRRSNAAHTATTTLLQKWIRAIQMRKIDASVSVAYFLSMACLGSIVVLLPTISELPPSAPMTISSLATIGGAIGKFINGFVCQTIGCSTCAVVYLLGLSCFSLAFSHATTIRTLALCGAGMEFAHSIMWTSFAVILSTHYGSDGIGLARGMTAMALSSSAASLFVKCFVGPVLLKVADWRVMAKLGAASAFVGCLVVHFMLRNVDVEKNNHDHDFKKDEQNDNQSNSFRKKKKTTVSGASEQKANTIRASLQAVVRNKLFWYAGGAQGFATLARSSDKILGVFYRDCTGVPAYLSGGLTCSVTLGLMHGLTTSRTGDFVDAPDLKHKQAFVRTRYIRTVSATLLLALLAIASNTVRSSSTSNPNILLTIVTAVSSGVLASSIAWPFYQLPAMFSMAFGANKAVFLSFVDGMGFLWSSPVWAAAGWLVQNNVLGCGWAVAWGCLAVLLGVGGVLSFKAIDGHYYAAADADA
eukprot:CAMPEP_0116009046 /NCGR_PEP_ID=MMETSP0321-20121206/3210_1 /TAXON_ID=163516 /ORGANISM="Leptocylindrus danicus var. danicus, Strain B650" /LENGTH=496 /DNA_ID=CAMNT_0003477955 /DNA_START=1080 /DNA_END=2570 /DNA_ORIENTATION=+